MTTETKIATESSSTKSSRETISVATSLSSRLPTLNPKFDHGNTIITEQILTSSWIKKSTNNFEPNLGAEISTIASKTVTKETDIKDRMEIWDKVLTTEGNK